MSYVDQRMSNRRVVSIVIVAAIHVLFFWVFISGLGAQIVSHVKKDLKTFDVKELPPPPPDKPPPPPPDNKPLPPPPVVSPPPIVMTPPISAPQVQVVQTAPPPVITPTAPVAPPAPHVSQAASAKGDPRSWITNDDYPDNAVRNEKEGVSAIAWDINTAGRVENCHVTQSSGTAELDDTACRLVTRRGKYSPAKDQNGQPIVSHASVRFRWVLPQ